ncbi:MAG: hypothetical protein LQ340_003899 [Diploschistes diacapsis]|nr:MAG: hypothetical protein LQ340_003899 [Diploschistes diacapsis]
MPKDNMGTATMTRQHQTANAYVAAFNAMDVDAVAGFRAPNALRYILPSTLGHPPHDNATYIGSLRKLLSIFHSFSLTCHELVEDVPGRRIVMYLTARGDTDAGEYVNEYVWFLDFDESGDTILGHKEFVDAIMNRDFWPKLAKAMKAKEKK